MRAAFFAAVVFWAAVASAAYTVAAQHAPL